MNHIQRSAVRYGETLLRTFKPRHDAYVRHASAMLYATVALALVLGNVVDLIAGVDVVFLSSLPSPHPSWFLGVILPIALLAMSVLLWKAPASALPVLIPISWATGVIANQVITLFTKDNTTTGVIFLYTASIYAAYAFSRQGALVAWVITSVLLSVVQVSLGHTGQEVGLVAFNVIGLAAVMTVLSVARDRQVQVDEFLAYQADHDPLTDLVNRNVVDQAIEAFDASSTSPGAALLVIDADGFKHLNDTYGHPIGDQVLVALAQQLRDLPWPGALPSRVGGDEFVVFLPHASSQEAEGVAAALVHKVASHAVDTTAGTFATSISVGVAHYPTHTNSMHGLFAVADDGLYVAKRLGRGQHATPLMEYRRLPRLQGRFNPAACHGSPADNQPQHDDGDARQAQGSPGGASA